MQEGTLELYDLGACTRIHVEKAHSGPVWSLALLPDKSGFVSGSADKAIKFWTWTVVTTPITEVAAAGDGEELPTKKKGTKEGGEGDQQQQQQQANVRRQLGVLCTRQLEMADDVLCVRVSPDGRLLAASLLDATIKVYYVDR
jgi:U3 small nucleolar RNA-associated protein 12